MPDATAADASSTDIDAALGAGADAGPPGEPTVEPVPEFADDTFRQSAMLAQLNDGRVLVAGGRIVLGGVTGREETQIYDLATLQITDVDPLHEGRSDGTATTLPDGKVIVIGGRGGMPTGFRASAEVFDPATGSFELLASTMSAPRAFHGAWLMSSGSYAGKVLVVGGAAGAAPEVYDPATKQFSPLGGADAPPLWPGQPVLLDDGRVLLVGARSADDSDDRDCYIYDPEAGAFSLVGRLSSNRNAYQPVKLGDGRVLIAGGYETGGVTDVDIFNPETRQLTPHATGLAGPIYYYAAATFPSGRAALAGGATEPGVDVNTVLIFDPLTDEFFPASGTLGGARVTASTLNLADGRILILGGTAIVDGRNTFYVSNVDILAE